MKILCYSDTHFHHAWPEFNPVEPNGKTRWLNIQVDVWSQIDQIAKDQDVAVKVFSGDLVHKRSFTHVTVLDSIIELYKSGTVQEVLAVGNHDRHSPEFNSVAALNGIGTVRVLPDAAGNFLGFVSNAERVAIYAATPGGPIPVPAEGFTTTILLAHGILNGATSQSGFELEGGYNLEDFKAFSAVVLGDVHSRQTKGNVLIPGAPMQMSWGDSELTCGCWLLETQEPADRTNWVSVGTCWVKFFPLSAPRFIKVTQDNFEAVLALTEKEPDTYNYYDFRLTEALDPDTFRELKRRCPNSYLVAETITEAKVKKAATFTRDSTPEEILRAFHSTHFSQHAQFIEEFVKQGVELLFQADPKQGLRGARTIEIEYIRAQNFLSFQDITLDFRNMAAGLYQVTGTSDDETSQENGTGKSALAVEVLVYTFFDTLARTKTRSRDKFIHDPLNAGKAKGLLTEVGLRIQGVKHIVQRYRKHPVLGSGSRILQQEVVVA